MNWLDDVMGKLKRKNQILFSKNSLFLQDLELLLRNQDRRAVVLWAFDLAEETVKKLETKYPAQPRPRHALNAAKLWASGQIKMPIAKKEILNCHAFAKELHSPEDIALCHAVAQACSTVHTNGHAIGFPVYDLTAIVYHYGIADCKAPVEARKQEYIQKMMSWQSRYEDDPGTWADFLCK